MSQPADIIATFNDIFVLNYDFCKWKNENA